MIRLITTLFFAVVFSSLIAQKVDIKEMKNRIGNDSRVGVLSTIIGEKRVIESKWHKQLRTFGRLKEEGNYVTVREAEMDGIGNIALKIYSKITENDSLVEVWLGGDFEDLPEDSVSLIKNKLRTLLYEFSLQHYLDEAQGRIDEAERAVGFTEKKQQKLINEGVELKKDLDATQQEIIRLTDLLEKNKLDEKVFKQKITDNQVEQDTTATDLIRLKKIVEVRKAEKSKIE